MAQPEIERVEAVIYQVGINRWKLILFDVTDKHYRKLIEESEHRSRYVAEDWAKMRENKLLCDLEPTDIF